MRHGGFALIATTVLILLGAAPSCASAAAPANPEIAEGDAATTLREFAWWAHLSVAFDQNAVAGTRMRALDRSLSPRAALEHLLADTGLTYKFINDYTVVVYRKRPPNPQEPAHDASPPIYIVGRRPDDLSLRNYSIDMSDAAIAQTGHSTLQSALRDLTQSNGDLCEDGIGDSSPESKTNSARGCGENLRGLGASATKVLFDWNPMAPGGTRGAFVDIAQIPVAAIDHLEILPDGSSPLYGADAIGGIVNFLPRKTFSGSETLLRYAPTIGSEIGEKLFSQLWGWGAEENAGGVIALEYYSRADLPAASRRQATNDLRSLGGSNFDSAYSSPPNILLNGGLHGLQVSPVDGHVHIDPTAVPNDYDTLLGTDILPAQQRGSAYTHVHVPLGGRCKMSGAGLLTRRDVKALSSAVGEPLSVPPDNPFYPPGTVGPLQIEYGFQRDLGPTILRAHVWDGNLASGLSCTLAGSWRLESTAGYTFEQQHQSVGNLVNSTALAAALGDPSANTAFDPFGSLLTNRTTLGEIRGTSTFLGDSRVRFGRFVAQGTTASGWGPDLGFTLGSDFRFESLSTYEHQDGLTPDTSLDATRTVAALFAEACVPINTGSPHQCTDEGNGDAPQLHLRVSGRYEHYTDFGGGSVPALNLFWMPDRAFSWRASWSRSFRVPDLADLSETSNVSTLLFLPNPTLSNSTPTLVWSGNNAGLRRESARTSSLTASIRPSFDPQMKIEAHYYTTTFSNRIDAPEFVTDALTDPTTHSWITLNPSAAEQQEVCSRSRFIGGNVSCINQPVGAIADFRLQNISRLDTRGVDVNLSRDLVAGQAIWKASVGGTYIFRYVLADPSGAFDLVNTLGNPLRVRLRSIFSLSWRDWDASATVLYSGAYRDLTSTPYRDIRSWTTVNTQVVWKLPFAGHAAGTQLALDVQNLFGAEPPFANDPAGVGWDPYNASILGRVVKLTLTLRL